MNDNMKQTTIYDISQKADVSIATVSRVLNGSPKVNEKTKERVLKIMKELHYEPNAFARGLGTGSMKTIGILCADVADIYLANAVSFLERELRQNGFDSVLNCTGYDYETKRKGMRIMESRRVDAVIMVGSQYIEKTAKRNEYIIEAAKAIPVMLLNGSLDGDNIYCNLSDDYAAFYEATEKLIQKGCKNIMFLYREMSYSRNKKYEGYCDALRKYEIPINQNVVFQSNNKMQEIKEELKELYKKGADFDAILACDDELAIGALKFTQEFDIKVPEQMSIIGCNNSVLSICCEPELSSIDNKCEMLCVNTVAMLMRVLEQLDVSQKVVISAKFIERKTTKK